MLQTAADAPVLLDTGAALALSLEDHQGHPAAVEALAGRALGLAGYAAFETFSVRTRLPPAAQLGRGEAAQLISFERAAELLDQLPELGIAGGAVYDALVGATAVEHDLVLVSRDHRASATYRRLDVQVELL